MSSRLHGIVPAIATPFNERFEVDKDTLRHLVEWYISCGVHGISVCGSLGEFFTLDRQERLRVIEAAVRAVDGRVPVYAGTGAVTTRESIDLTGVAERMGADVAMVITPYFISPSADELVQHYKEIAEAAKIPVLIYNNPPRTGVNVTPEIYRSCLRAENIIGIKDSSGDITQICEYVALGGDDRVLFAGRDTVILSAVLHGGSGAVSPAANVFPELVVQLYGAVRGGRIEEARRLSDILAPLRQAWALGSFPVVIKEAMTLVGRSAGPARPPIRPLSSEAREKLKAVIRKIEADSNAARASAVA